MRSSRGFASTAPDYVALFRLAFASASPQSGLTWPVTVSRRIIMQKARHHPGSRLRLTLSQGNCKLKIDHCKLQIEKTIAASSNLQFSIYNSQFSIPLQSSRRNLD